MQSGSPAAAFSVGSVQFQHGHMSVVSSVAFSPVDPSLLASGSYDNTVRLWNTTGMMPVSMGQGDYSRQCERPF